MKKLSSLIAPCFYKLHKDVQSHNHNTYLLKGGRGSTKSSWIAIEVILLIIKHSFACAVVFMKHQNRLRKGVMNLYLQTIKRMGLESLFEMNMSSFTLTYLPTGQYILFMGLDDPYKTKGVTVDDPNRYFAIVHFEEYDQFYGKDEINTTLESISRGGDVGWIFECFNPPENRNNWANRDSRLDVPGRIVHYSNYKGVPKEWLGQIFFDQMNAVKALSFTKYQHRYLGVETGNGGAVFTHIVERPISDSEKNSYECIYQGSDYGFFPDPYVFVRVAYVESTRTVVLLDELWGNKRTIPQWASIITSKHLDDCQITIDGAISSHYTEYTNSGVNVRTANKGAGSVERGINWLQTKNFVIDKSRTPHCYEEMIEYEYERDKFGDYTGKFPDHNNHCIDAIRYAMSGYFDLYGDPLFEDKS